jgi:hypothetical protein
LTDFMISERCRRESAYTTIASSFKRVASKTLTAINPATGSSAAQGKTEYSYDDYSVTDRGTGVPNHIHSTTATGRGNLRKTRVYKDASNYLETQMKYDNPGNLIETIDPLSHSTTIDFTDLHGQRQQSHDVCLQHRRTIIFWRIHLRIGSLTFSRSSWRRRASKKS